MDLLRQGLAPFVEREVQEEVRVGAVSMDTVRRFSEDPALAKKSISQWDAAGLLKLMSESWNAMDVFRSTLGVSERNLGAACCSRGDRAAEQGRSAPCAVNLRIGLGAARVGAERRRRHLTRKPASTARALRAERHKVSDDAGAAWCSRDDPRGRARPIRAVRS
jgi:hypothetical protein